jgi:hypothetical protein
VRTRTGRLATGPFGRMSNARRTGCLLVAVR